MNAVDEVVGERKCEKHGTPTLLSCAQCERPICPRCSRYTEVGQKCTTCAGGRDVGKKGLRPGLIAVIALVFLLVGGLAYLGSDSFQGSKPDPTSPGATKRLKVDLGEEVTEKGVTFVVSEFNCGASEVGDEEQPNGVVRAKGRYCFLSVTATNTGDNPSAFTGALQFLLDDAGKRYLPDIEATLVNGQGDRDVLATPQMNPGVEVQGILVYDVPEAVEPIEAELHAGITTASTRVGGAAPAGGVRVRLGEPTT